MSFCKANRDLAGILQRKVFEGPRHVVVDLTNRCNTNCLVCWTYSPMLKGENKPHKTWYKEEIEIGAFESLVRELSELGVERIRFTGGGEPLLHRSIERAIEVVKENGIWLAITTNGLLLDRYHQLLTDKGVDEVAVSLWAGSEKSYLEQHPKNKSGDYFRILESVRSLTEAGVCEVHLLNVINRLNYHEIGRMGDLGRNLGAKAVYFTLVDAMEDTRGMVLDESMPRDAVAEVEHLRNKFYVESEGMHWDNLDGFELRLLDSVDDVTYDKSRIDAFPCYMGWHFIRVTANGDVVPCCKGVDYPMGNIHQNSFREIWSGEAYHEFRSKGLELTKDDPYFEKMNCYQMCDNLMHIEEIQRRLDSLTETQKSELMEFKAPALQILK